MFGQEGAGDGLRVLSGVDVVILGEVHDNPAHHRNQAAVIAAHPPRAIVFEMLSPAQAGAVAGLDRTDAAALEAATGWAESGWPDFAMYAPIFAAAPEARILGAAVPTATLREAMRDGAGAVGDHPLPPVPPDQRAARLALQDEAHCGKLPPEMLPGMIEAQRLRDAALAAAALAALEQTGGPVAVITGNGHARRDWGIPAHLAARAPDITVLSLGQLEAAEADPPFDLWLVTDPVDRNDPCAAFR